MTRPYDDSYGAPYQGGPRPPTPPPPAPVPPRPAPPRPAPPQQTQRAPQPGPPGQSGSHAVPGGVVPPDQYGGAHPGNQQGRPGPPPDTARHGTGAVTVTASMRATPPGETNRVDPLPRDLNPRVPRAGGPRDTRRGGGAGDGSDGGHGTQSPGRPSGGRRVAGVLSTLLALAIAGTSATVWGVSSSFIKDVKKVQGVGRETKSGEPMTILVAASDSRQGLSRAEINQMHLGTEECNCTDTMMLVRIPADRSKVTVVNLPRDSWVTYRGTRGRGPREGRLNSAYTLGGGEALVKTVEAETGIPVDHYLEMNFMAFVRVIDAMGGVDMCLAKPFIDVRNPRGGWYNGMNLPAGANHLDGSKALRFVRARHVGGTDGSDDESRIPRQQEFIGALTRKATSSDTLLSPSVLGNLFAAVKNAIQFDEALKIPDLITLGTNLKGLNPSSAVFAKVPIKNRAYHGGAVLWDREEARELFANMAADKPLAGEPTGQPAKAVTTAPGKIRIRVFNGGGTAGLGRRAADDLARAGYKVLGAPGNWTEGQVAKTTVYYDPEFSESIRTVQASLPGADLVPKPGLAGIRVVVGPQWGGTTPVTVAGKAAGPAAKAPKTTTAAQQATNCGKR